MKWVDPWFGRPYDPANPFEAFGETGRTESSGRQFKPEAFRQVQTCLYRECGRGCRGSVCHWRKVHVGLDVCYECLKSMGDGE